MMPFDILKNIVVKINSTKFIVYFISTQVIEHDIIIKIKMF